MRISTGLLVCCIIFSSLYVKAIGEIFEIKLDRIVSLDEVPVDFVVNSYLRFESDVIITESNKVYINIEDLFRNMGIKCVSENEGNYLSGFILTENKTYNIDFYTKQLIVGERTIKSINGIIKESGAIFIESTVITEAFGLNILFNFRLLSIKMEANFELPAVKQMRLEQMRKNIAKLQDREIIADTILKRDYHLFKFGMVDWSLESFQTINETSSNRVRIGVGTELFYGQANVSIYYNDRYKFENRNLYYNWRWVDNEKNIIKQAQLGKISYNSISYISSPVVGGSINNSPNTVRKASGYYTINEYTEPNWTVELYINDVLVDYVVADASGLFIFKVPNVYGLTTLKLKFYGPMGEERIEERTRNIPITFMPAKEFEYSLSAGVLEDGVSSRFGRGDFSYGVNRFVTIGGGVEYLSSIINSPFIPFAQTTIQPFNKLIVNLEYAYDVRMRGLLSYNFGQSTFLEIDYTDYVDGQKAVLFKPDKELKVRLSVPFKLNKISGFAKLNYNQNVYSDFKYNQIDAAFSGYYKNYSANLSALVNWVSDSDPYVTSTLVLSYRMKNGLVVRPLAEYNIRNSELVRCKVEIVKRVAKAYFSVSYERNVAYKTDNVFIGFRYDLPFARTGISALYDSKKLIISENAEGSIAFGSNNTVITGNNSAVGKGGILLYPFLDLNNNGSFDKGEQMILLSKVRVSGGRAVISEKDSIVRISDLNAFVDYIVEFSDNDLDNIAWRFKNTIYQIMVDPNQYKRVYVPILSLGEISGMVYLNNNNNLDGLGRITVQIYNKQGKKVAETLSESDGYYSYLGLNPNDYVVRIDEEQLKILDYQSTPLKHNAVITQSVDGDFLDGLDFVLNSKEKRTEDSLVQQNIINLNIKEEVFENMENIKIVSKAVFSPLPTKDSIESTTLPEKKNINDSIHKNNISQKTTIKSASVNPAPGKNISANKTKTNSNINTSFGKISDINGLFYSVQIGVYKNYVTAKQLKNLTPIFYETLPNGNNRYFSGKYNSAAEAEKAKNVIIAKGIKDAFVVTISKGVKLAVIAGNQKNVFNKNIADRWDFAINRMNN